MTNCKFCDPEKFDEINVGRYSESKAPLIFRNWYGQAFIIVSLGREYRNEYHFKFCPECGRRINRPGEARS